MTDKTQLCIIGLGRAGRFHLNSIKNIDSCELKYVVDPQLDEDEPIVLQNKFILLNNVEPALSDPDLQGVIVSAPTQFHFEYINRALDAGKHVFTEKPLGKTPLEINTCFEKAEASDLALFLGFQRRYDHNFKTLKKNIEQIGQVRMVRMSSRDNPKPSLEYLRISGNIFHDMLIHDFDMLQFLLGSKIPATVFAFGHAYDPDIKAIPDFDTVMVTLKYADGLICSIDTSREAAYGYDQRIELFGDKGMIKAENQRNNTVQIHTEKGLNQSPINFSFPQRYEASYTAEIEDFVNGIRNGKNNNVSREDCWMGHVIADAAHKSATQNKVVDFKKFIEKMSN